MQKPHFLLHPSITVTYAFGPRARAAVPGGNSTGSPLSARLMERPSRRASSRSSPSRAMVRGPITRSTQGARRKIASPSTWATHPQTPMTISGRSLVPREKGPQAPRRGAQRFGNDPRLVHHGHEIGVPVPPRHHVQVIVTRDPGSCAAPEIHAEIDSGRPVEPSQGVLAAHGEE